MEPVRFADAETYEPDDGWRRVAMAGSDAVSIEYFEKPPGHSSPMHDHQNEQVCLCLAGELTVTAGSETTEGDTTETDTAVLGSYDSVRLASGEPHRVENTGSQRAVGLDVFAPGRSFDFWLDRTE